VKKECDRICEKIMADKKAGLQTSATTGHLRRITELLEENELDIVATPDTLSDTPSNDTNESDLYYFARLSNHYLRLVKSNSSASVDCCHYLCYPIIADSGANFHMFKHPEFFTTMQPLDGHVILGDGQTTLPIQGIGTMSCIIDGHSLLLHDGRFVPQLSESIFSLLQHIKQPNHGLHSSFETGLYVSFPGIQTKAIVGKDDIYLNILPALDNLDVIDAPFFPETMSQEVNDSVNCHTTDVTSGNEIVTKDMDHLLKSLRQYYATVKTKCQLNLHVPAGFCQATNLQTLFWSFTPPRKSKSAITVPQASLGI
jgi:hypothetical protein